MTGRFRRYVIPLVSALLACVLFFSLRDYRRPGGDSEFALGSAESFPGVFYVRSPLTCYLHRLANHYVFRPLHWPVVDTIGFCSAVAGGIFVAALLTISSHPLFLLFNLAAPLLFLFLGHVEHYAWVNALLVVYFVAVKKHLDDGRPLWPALVLLLLAASSHMLAIFYVPSFLYLLVARDRTARSWRWSVSRREGEILLSVFVVWALVFSGAQMVFPVAGLNNGFERLVPLVMPDGPSRYHFSLFSVAHLKMWIYFQWMASPLGLPGLILLGHAIESRFEKFLLAATACTFLWTWLWHPDFAEGDWDLFANVALPLNVLVGLLLARLARRWPSRNTHNTRAQE